MLANETELLRNHSKGKEDEGSFGPSCGRIKPLFCSQACKGTFRHFKITLMIGVILAILLFDSPCCLRINPLNSFLGAIQENYGAVTVKIWLIR